MEKGEPSGDTWKVAASAIPPADTSSRARATCRGGENGQTDPLATATAAVAVAGGVVAVAFLDARVDDLDVGVEPITPAAPRRTISVAVGRDSVHSSGLSEASAVVGWPWREATGLGVYRKQ